MERKDIKGILQIILSSTKNKKLLWRLDGSANLLIQGVDVSVRDLDIATDDDGINVFRATLKKHIVNDCINPKTKGPSLVCNIDGFEVEINSYGPQKLMPDKIEIKSWQNMQMPILLLRDAQKFYEIIGRKEKVEIIAKHLKR